MPVFARARRSASATGRRQPRNVSSRSRRIWRASAEMGWSGVEPPKRRVRAPWILPACFWLTNFAPERRCLELGRDPRTKAPEMKLEVSEITRQGALHTVSTWRDRGCEYASIIDGVPRPWAPKSFKLIFADAEQRGVELLSLANADHVKGILAAMFEFVERSLIASQAAAELRKFGLPVARGGDA